MILTQEKRSYRALWYVVPAMPQPFLQHLNILMDMKAQTALIAICQSVSIWALMRVVTTDSTDPVLNTQIAARPVKPVMKMHPKGG